MRRWWGLLVIPTLVLPAIATAEKINTPAECYQAVQRGGTVHYRGRTGLAACDLLLEDERYEAARKADALRRLGESLDHLVRPWQYDERWKEEQRQEALRRQRMLDRRLNCTTTYGPFGSTTRCW